MTLRLKKGDIFKTNAEVLVNPVNAVGVSGRGLALAFKLRYYSNYCAYRDHATKGRMQAGDIFPVRIGGNPAWIVNVATKAHWKEPSQIQWISNGISNLVQWCEQNDIENVAIPPLGCGLGGLDFAQVLPLLTKAFENSTVQAIVLVPENFVLLGE